MRPAGCEDIPALARLVRQTILRVNIVSVDGRGYLHSLFVHSEHQGEGIATALLLMAEDYARSRGAVRLCSEVSWTARRFFLARGFREIALQKVEVNGVSMENFRMEKPL